MFGSVQDLALPGAALRPSRKPESALVFFTSSCLICVRIEPPNHGTSVEVIL